MVDSQHSLMAASWELPMHPESRNWSIKYSWVGIHDYMGLLAIHNLDQILCPYVNQIILHEGVCPQGSKNIQIIILVKRLVFNVRCILLRNVLYQRTLREHTMCQDGLASGRCSPFNHSTVSHSPSPLFVPIRGIIFRVITLSATQFNKLWP